MRRSLLLFLTLSGGDFCGGEKFFFLPLPSPPLKTDLEMEKKRKRRLVFFFRAEMELLVVIALRPLAQAPFLPRNMGFDKKCMRSLRYIIFYISRHSVILFYLFFFLWRILPKRFVVVLTPHRLPLCLFGTTPYCTELLSLSLSQTCGEKKFCRKDSPLLLLFPQKTKAISERTQNGRLSRRRCPLPPA